MYNKIFTKILDSSIWLEPDATRIVWLTCLAAMDEDGFVQFAGVPNLARRANVELDACVLAVQALESPDSNSSDPDHDGRRLERVPGGWIVLNAGKYRELVTRVVSREQTRLRVARHRARNARNKMLRNTNAVVTPSEAVSEAVSETTTEATTTSEDRRIADRRSQELQAPKSYNRTPPLSMHLKRLKVWRWMLDAWIGRLGDHADGFGLDEWLHTVDADTSVVLPGQADYWPWLDRLFSAEVRRRGLPLASAAAGEDEDLTAAIRADLARRPL